jgi:hypothetical membrane protein
MRAKSRKPSFDICTILAMVCVAGPVLFGIVLAVTQSLYPGYSPIRQSTSDLAFSPYGWLLMADFFFLGLVIIVFGVALYFSMQRKRRLQIVAGLFIFTGLSEFIVSIFKSDFNKSSPPTLHALIHQGAASVNALVFPAAAFLMLPSLKSDPRWKGVATYTAVAAGVMIGLLIFRLAWLFAPWLNDWWGLYERVLLLNSFIWFEIMAIRLLRIYRHERLKT